MIAFRTHTDAFAEANAQVLGVSVDSFAAVGEFQEKLGLEFPLVSDFPKNQAGRDYGIFNEDFGFHNRATFVIDSEGIVRDAYLAPRDFESHAPHALEVLQELNGS
ncbi:MAG: redoxin domain-containing protein [Dehalococcoidia bacterium]|nr:redoxin domain-containing protein [Dehalococcoidia bacterium]